MRLTLVMSSLGAGGAERAATIMAAHWIKNRDLTLLTFDDAAAAPFNPLPPRIAHHHLDLMRGSENLLAAGCNNLWRMRRLRVAIKAGNPDCVVSFLDQTNVLTLLAARGTGIPVVVMEQVFSPAHHIGSIWDVLRRLSYPKAVRVVTPTRRAIDGLPKRVRASAIVIPNPVQSFTGSGAKLIRRAADQRIVLAAGRLNPQKGHDLLLNAFATLKDRHPDWSLIILGEGPQRQAIESMRARLGLADRVAMPGVAMNLEDYFRQADLFVMASRYEGFPLALAEAMASGLPVISTDCPTGPREMITDGVDGLLVPTENVDALVAAMDRLMSDDQARQKLAARAPEVTQRFGVEKVMALWDRLLDEVVKEKDD